MAKPKLNVLEARHRLALIEGLKENKVRENKELKVSKFRLAFIVLLIATIIWGSAFYHTLQEHRKYIAWLESPECPLVERLNYLYGWVPAYWRWNGGKYVCLTAPFLLLAWIGFIAVAIGKLSERKKRTAVNGWREILKKILKALKAFLLGFFHMDYQIEDN